MQLIRGLRRQSADCFARATQCARGRCRAPHRLKQSGFSSAASAAAHRHVRGRRRAAARFPGAVVLIVRDGKVAYLRSIRLSRSRRAGADAARRDLPHRLDDQAGDHRRGADAGRGGQAAAHGSGIDVSAAARDSCRSASKRSEGTGERTPDARAAAPRTITVQDLMRHTSGMTYGSVRRLAGAARLSRREHDGRSADERRDARQAGEAAAGVSARHDVRVRHVERRGRAHRRSRLSGMDLNQFVAERIAQAAAA